jgi:hypothetical protein
MAQRYTILVTFDYRGGIDVEHEKVGPDWYEEMEAAGSVDSRFDVMLRHPRTGHRVYWVCEHPDYAAGPHWDFQTRAEAERHMVKVYSQLNGRLPFVPTEDNDDWTLKGHFPEVSDDIRQLPEVALPPRSHSPVCLLMLLDQDGIVGDLVLENG